MTYEADAAGFLQIVALRGRHARDRRRDRAAGSRAPTRRRPPPPSAPAARGGRSSPWRPPRCPSRRQRPHAEPAAQAAPAAARRARRADSRGGRVKASPVARRIAAELGVDLADAHRQRSRRPHRQGRRDGGRRRASARRAAAARRPCRRRGAATRARSRSIEPTRTQQLIARRMASAKATIPEFQVTVEVDAEAALALREQLRGQTEPLPSINDLVIKACALALRAHPRVNAAYVDGHFEQLRPRQHRRWRSPATGRSSCRRSSTPTSRSLVEIAVDDARAGRQGARRHADAARARRRHVHRLEPRHVRRRPLHRRDQSAAGGDPRGRARPRRARSSRRTGRSSMRRVMELTISADHRIVYGADAADFLGTVRKRLERPAGLLL